MSNVTICISKARYKNIFTFNSLTLAIVPVEGSIDTRVSLTLVIIVLK